MTLERGSLLNNRYRIVEILGQGGMGSIYRAIDENLGVEVAVKENLFTTEDYARQFRREAVILANLRHPNLPRVTDHFVIEPQGQYLIMDFIQGEDLRERMDREGNLPDAEVVILGSALCDALSYLHSLQPQIVHRDIKPGNVKITPTGQIILVDFGLAKVLQSGQSTTTGARAMTPGYSPPEQYGTARTDERSDIYSLGATLYVALTGELPEDALARAMGQTDLTPVRRYNPKVSRKLAAAIEKAMELRPDDRFRSADEFKQALLNTRIITGKPNVGENTLAPAPQQASEQALGPNGDSARLHSAPKPKSPAEISGSGMAPLLPTSTPLLEPVYNAASPKPARKVKRRRGCLYYLLILGSLLGIAIVGIIFYQPSLWNEAVVTAERFLSTNSIPIDLAFLSPLASPTPTGTLPATSQTPGPEKQVTRTPLDNNVAAPATTTSAPTQTPTLQSTSTLQPTLSPTPVETPQGGGSGLLAYASDESGLPQIWLMNTDGTVKRQVTEMLEGACQPAWAPNGERLAFISPCGGNQEMYPGASLFIIDIHDPGSVLQIPTQPGGDFDPDWSPDGSQIIFTSLRDYNLPQIYSLRLADNSFKSISNNTVRDLQPDWSPDGQKIVFVSTRLGPNQLWIMDQYGRNAEMFTRSGSLKNSHPAWSPDSPEGQNIMFTQNKVLMGVPRLVAMRVGEGNFTENWVTREGIPMKESAYSPDGMWIAFESWPDGTNHDIFIMTSNGVGRQRVTDQPGEDFDAAWQPTLIP